MASYSASEIYSSSAIHSSASSVCILSARNLFHKLTRRINSRLLRQPRAPVSRSARDRSEYRSSRKRLGSSTAAFVATLVGSAFPEVELPGCQPARSASSMYRSRAKDVAERSNPARSAPEKPCVAAASAPEPTAARARASRHPRSRSRFECIWRMACRPAASGKSTHTCTSSRPGRSRAGSTSSGRLVRPTTRMLLSSSTPSSLASSWLTTESRIPLVSPRRTPRSRQKASSSSSTMTCSADKSPRSACSSSASVKSARTNDSDSPTNLFIISGPFTIFGSRAPSAAPISRASSVFPQPGGP
mmetsp:Transcript_31538/g.67827  ORF Transcript_31538/g.67827 Transcript_31538/m.67827 type:complete len:303 (+) Transcript_31538:246-1154(+)